MDTKPEILIVGGGPSGLILALSLLKNGIQTRVIEKNASPRIGQRGAGIMPRSLELFAALGMEEVVLERAILTPPVRMYEVAGGREPIREFEMAPRHEPTPAYPFRNIVLLGQDTLEKFLHAALAKFGCQVELGSELISFEQADDRVHAKLTKPAPEGGDRVIENASFDWVIGTDGARGIVRKLLGLSFLGETRTMENMVVGDIHVEGLSPEYWHIWGNAATTLISLRPTDVPTMFNFVIAGENINNAKLSADENALRECFLANTGRRDDLKFGDITWLSNYTPSIRMVDRFGDGRVYIAGDAAHVHSPTGGQGMNTGIQDSLNLGWKLALVQKKLAPRSLLDTYAEERLPVIAEMLNQTTQIMNKTFKQKDESGWKRPDSLFQLGVNYRWSTIVVDEQKKEIVGLQEEDEDDDDDDENEGDALDSYGYKSDGRLRAGDRAPDAPGLIDRKNPNQSAQRLFKVFGVSHHTILVFAENAHQRASIFGTIAALPKGVARSILILRPGAALPANISPLDLIMEDQQWHVNDAYDLRRGCDVVVVRPDGVIGAIVKGPQGVKRYFDGIFGITPPTSH